MIFLDVVTIKDVAQKSGVSIGTVSRVLNKSGFGYSSKTYDHVRKIADSLGYIPNQMARSLITKKTHTIGLIMMNIANPFFPELTRGIESKAAENNLSILLCNSDDNNEKEGAHIRLLAEKCVDGIILTTASLTDNDNIDALLKTTIPFVVVDVDANRSNFFNISVDHYGGAKKIVQYLIDHSHRRIACITGPQSTESSQLRRKGYIDALVDNQITIDNDLIVEGNYRPSGGENAVKLLSCTPYTAIFCSNDMMAIGVYKELRKCRLRIPKDVSVVGFDDITFSSIIDPPLTTMRQPAYEIGRSAVDLLKEAMGKKQENHDDPVYSKTFGTELVIRGSVRSIKK